MIVPKTMQEMITRDKVRLGSTDWLSVGSDRLAAFARFADLGEPGSGSADLSAELDPLAAMSLVPYLLGSLFYLSDAEENRIISVSQCMFLSPIAVGIEFRMEAVLVSGEFDVNGHLAYKLGVEFYLRNEPFPCIAAEVNGLAGNG